MKTYPENYLAGIPKPSETPDKYQVAMRKCGDEYKMKRGKDLEKILKELDVEKDWKKILTVMQTQQCKGWGEIVAGLVFAAELVLEVSIRYSEKNVLRWSHDYVTARSIQFYDTWHS